MKQPYIRDARLVLFAALAVLSSIIAAHGSLGFFGFIVDPGLDLVYTAVVALGIIGLAAAGAMASGWPRLWYYGGMLLFLVLETLANYFFGQEHFVTKVANEVAPGSDLAGLAADPFWGRALVVLYLSLASIAVAAFTHKAAHRFAEVRRTVAAEDGRRAKARRMLARRRERFAGLADQLRDVRAATANERDMVALLRDHRESDRAELENLRAELNETEVALAMARGESDDLREQSAGLREQLAKSRKSDGKGWENVATRDLTITALRAENDQLRAELEERVANLPPTRATVVAYSLDQQAAGRSRKSVADELGFAEGTLREWEKVAANGHGEEVAK